jgi:fatty-acyl-CoA synthase
MTAPLDPRAWLRQPREDRGIHMASDDGSWEFHSYPEIAMQSRKVAAAMIADGVRAGDRVVILLPTGTQCLTAYFGAWVAGATPCLITPPSFSDEDGYVGTAAAIFEQARPALTVTSPQLADITARALDKAGCDGQPWLWRESAQPAPVADVGQEDFGLLQFTSGSSGVPRGVQVSWSNLTHNLTVIRSWLDWRDEDVTASWLPLFHDMGLVGTLLTTVVSQSDLWQMRPSQFIRDPGRWLECLSFASITAAPSFAYDLVAKRVRPDRLRNLDFSALRNVIVGAELIDPRTLESFSRLLEPHGFERSAFRTAYGMAEATLAVTAVTSGNVPRVVRPDPETLTFGGRIGINADLPLGELPSEAGNGWLVSCGPASCGVGVAVVDEDGAELPPGHLGEIAVTGDSVTAGYYLGRTANTTRFANGVLFTGDAGFLRDGELYVLGRMGDSLKVRGRSIYVEDLEAVVRAATGLPWHKCVVVAMAGPGHTGVVLFVESPPGDWVQLARQALIGELGADAEVAVVTGEPGLIKRTTSGKPRRRALWESFRSYEITSTEPQGARSAP